MKKHILLGAALLSLFAASCSNDDIINNDNEVVTGKTITLNATINNGADTSNNGADTRMTYTDNGSSMQVAWSKEESFTMYKGTSGTGSTFTNSADNTGKFKGDDIEGEGKYYAVYGEGITNTDGTLTIDLSGAQVGTSEENSIKEFMLASAEALNSSTTLTFDHKLTVLKMTLTLPSEVKGTVNEVTVGGLHNKASYALSSNAYAYADTDKGDITATNGSDGFAIDAETHKFTAYVAVFPESVSANQVTISATVGDKEYSYTIAGARELAAGKVVPVKVTLVHKTNFKSVYTADDYKTWSEADCGSAATAEQMKMYLGAGVYWDNGEAGDNQQTFITPDGNTYHAGLWVMKKAYISGFSEDKAKKVVNTDEDTSCWHTGRPAASEIGKYFFLPVAGGYNYGDFEDAGSYGYYWSSSSSGVDNAYSLYFDYDNGYADVRLDYRGNGNLPMLAE